MTLKTRLAATVAAGLLFSASLSGCSSLQGGAELVKDHNDPGAWSGHSVTSVDIWYMRVTSACAVPGGVPNDHCMLVDKVDAAVAAVLSESCLDTARQTFYGRVGGSVVGGALGYSAAGLTGKVLLHTLYALLGIESGASLADVDGELLRCAKNTMQMVLLDKGRVGGYTAIVGGQHNGALHDLDTDHAAQQLKKELLDKALKAAGVQMPADDASRH